MAEQNKPGMTNERITEIAGKLLQYRIKHDGPGIDKGKGFEKISKTIGIPVEELKEIERITRKS